MALKQVGARTEGDVYQGLFFWRQAADLLKPNSLVDRVVLEHDEADGVDDVAVFYRAPGINDRGSMVSAAYFQLKYHVDRRDSYSSAALIDPAFINAKKSLLQRFYDAYVRLEKDHHRFLLHLASNWRWRDDDALAAQLREYDGSLPDKFFTDGPRGDLGKIREQWQAHLKLDSATFVAFARTLRFQLDHFGRRGFKESVYSKLEAVGLHTPRADHAACPYESLVQKFLMDGPNSFTPVDFRELCLREGLLVESFISPPHPISIGVRSFMRFAERLESEVDDIVCVTKYFDGRHPSSDTSWGKSAEQVLAFFGDPDRRARLRAGDSVIALECHGSLALLAGWELSRNSGVRAAPIQKQSPEAWRPLEGSPVSAAWVAEIAMIDADIDDVAICLSVTHDVHEAVKEYLRSADAPQIGRIVQLSPAGGPSSQSIQGASHAYQLAAQLPGFLASARPNRRARAHIFFACPNALMFFIGQQREALGRLALYEFDFGGERDGLYQLALSLPISASPLDETQEVHNDSED